MKLAWLWSWFTRSRQSPPHIVVYTRRDCHLCHVAWGQLERQQQRYGFRLEAVDVDSDSELVARYGDSVPVVTIDGKERFRGRVNEVLLRRLLRGN